jgi:CheY-like chemotaxis protein/Flp pilus assembly protein TadD
MDKRFEDFSARVLLVEPSGNVRGMISDVIKSLGFSSVQAMDSLKSALGYLEVEAADWVIAPVQPSEQINAMNFMRLLNEHEKFRDTVFTLLIDENEAVHLPKAFELGLLSWHSKSNMTKDGLVREFKDLFEICRNHDGNRVFVAFEYLQMYLRSAAQGELLVEACQELVHANPTSAFAVFSLAQNQFALGKRDDLLKTLGHARASEIPGWEKMAKELLSEGEEVQLRLPIKRVLVVDPDESIHNLIRDTLLKHSYEPEIRFEVDGESAIKWAEANPAIDLVIQDWRIPVLTGHVFLQRLRQMHAKMIPVVVLSSLLKRDDVPILNEMSVSTGVEKPFDEKVFVKSVFQALLQHSSPTTPKWIERKIIEKLALRDTNAVQKLYRRLHDHPQCTDDQRMYVQALRFYHAADFEAAKVLCAKAIQMGGEQIKTFTLLGRCLNHLRDFDGAIKCFERAQSLSPKNIERLCELAEAHSEAGHAAEAAQALDQAKQIDETSQVVVGAEAKMEIAKGNIEKARELMFHLGSIDQLVSDMNGSAVAWVRVGQFEKGVELYNRTLEAIPEDQQVTFSRVIYNLALAFSRKGDLASAKVTLDRANPSVQHSVRDKIASLRTKIERSLSSQGALQLSTARASNQSNNDANPWEIESSEGASLLASEPAIQGSQEGPLKTLVFGRCLMGIARMPDSLVTVSKPLLKHAPLFALRSAIARSEGMGAEKLAQDAS